MYKPGGVQSLSRERRVKAPIRGKHASLDRSGEERLEEARETRAHQQAIGGLRKVGISNRKDPEDCGSAQTLPLAHPTGFNPTF